MKTYLVKPGDTLSKIAQAFYGDPKKFDVIARANTITNPASIFVDQTLNIPELAAPANVSSLPALDAEKYQLPLTEYFHEPQAKRMIVLHFTAGPSASSAFNTFKNSPSKVATPYILDLDGTIYEIFPPDLWAIHLFRHKKGEFPLYYQLEKCTIPIEIVNVGPLKPNPKDPKQLNWWYPPHPTTGRETFDTRFCSKDETDRFVTGTYRGIDCYAAFTPEQYGSLNDLVAKLCNDFDIPKKTLPDRTKFDLETLTSFRGIVSHQNFREDKFDIGPAFEWRRIGL